LIELTNRVKDVQIAFRELINKLEELGNAIDKTELTRGFGKGAGRKRLREDACNNNQGKGDPARKRKKVHWS
jgi:hypothetical protein